MQKSGNYRKLPCIQVEQSGTDSSDLKKKNKAQDYLSSSLVLDMCNEETRQSFRPKIPEHER